MANYDGAERRRPRRPRFYDDYSTSDDDEGPGHRSQPSGDDRRARAERPVRPTAGTARRPSILVDPTESPSERAKRRPRENSNVRLRTSSDDDSEGTRDQRAATYRRRHDLERKTSNENRRFRARRDEYESDEGETLKKHRAKTKRRPDGDDRPRGDRRHDDDDDKGRRDKDRKPGLRPDDALPTKGRPRASSENPPNQARGVTFQDAATTGLGAAAGAGLGAAAAAAIAHGKRRDYDTDPESRLRRRRRSHREPGAERRRPDYDDRPPPPADYRPRRGYDDDVDRGYRSDEGRKRRDDYDRPPRYDRPRRDEPPYRGDHGGGGGGGLRPPRPRPEDYYSDYRDDGAYRRADRPRRERYEDDPRDYHPDDRRGRHDGRRPRYDDPYDVRDRRRSGGSDKNKKWQKEAGALFMTYALPYIQREGTKFVRKEAQKYLQKKGGPGGLL